MGKKVNRVGEESVNNFGSKMIIKEYRNATDIDVYFPEYNWIAKNKQYNNFKNGCVKCPYERRSYGIGYLGEGKYKVRENGKKTKCYKEWIQMLQRCYDPKTQERQPTYKGCLVCEEWHNFQNFAEWFYKHYYEVPNQRMELDKDILFKGNKIYSPDNCSFVPKDINNLFVKCEKRRGDLPIGVTYHKRDNVYEAWCAKIYIGRYNTIDSAFQSYKHYKENLIKKLADKFHKYLPKSTYDALYKYEVEITD